MVKVLIKYQYKSESDPQMLLRISFGDINVIKNQMRVSFLY